MKQYLVNLFMGVDQFCSTILGGHPDDTISQRLGRAEAAKCTGLVIWFRKLVDALAYLVTREEHHCLSSLEGKTDARELWNWGGSRKQIHVDDPSLD